MAVMKVITIMADSKKGWSEAANVAVRKAAKSVKNIKSVWVQDQSAVVKAGKIDSYRVTVKITFAVGA